MPRPFGYKVSDETKKKISEARIRRKNRLGFLNSKETRKKMSESCIKSPRRFWLGKNFSKEHRENLKISHIGIQLGEKHAEWKGDLASYSAKHIWMTYHYGKPKMCEHCLSGNKKMYHWANISGKYIRDRSDWLRLCSSCHKLYDIKKSKEIKGDLKIIIQKLK
jgi:hypothetical protein